MANGFVIYRGPSLLDGAPIVAIVVGLGRKSKNSKTGEMVQTYILRADIAPLAALKSGDDASICGDCKHRPVNGGACYVNVGQGPTSVYRAFTRGNYPDAPAELVADMCEGRMVRLGTYGDPAAVPAVIWRTLIAQAKGHTGYTHQWITAHQLRDMVMASADSAAEMNKARAMGWRTFRIRTADESLAERESVCPASKEAGVKTNCATCGMCNGARGRKGSVAIVVHGVAYKHARFIRNRNQSAAAVA